MKAFLKSAKENINSWKGLLGILLTGITIFNIINNVLNLTLPEVFLKMLEGYRTIFHFPFLLLEKYLHIKVSPYLKDIFVLWTIAAGSTARANNLTRNEKDFKAKFSLLRSITNPEWRRKSTYTNFRISIILNFYHWIWKYVIIFFSWPFILNILFKNTPYLMKYNGKDSFTRHYVYVGRNQIDSYLNEGYIRFKDLRYLFIWQIIYAFIAAVLLTFIFSMDK